MSMLPVRSPLPMRVPSTRSAPASRPSSAAATALPRSLWVCRETMIPSRRWTWLQKYSTWSAKTLGVPLSTVAGRLMMQGRSAVGRQTAVTASQTSTAYSHSVLVKLSGEYWNRHSVSGCFMASRCSSCAPWTAMALTASRSMPKTRSRCTVEVELYTWTMARLAPFRDSKVRAMSASRAWTSTCTVTSSGIRSSSINQRTKSWSGWLAEGKPTSISLTPIFTSRSQSRRF